MRLALISDNTAGIVTRTAGLAQKGFIIGIFIPESFCSQKAVNSSLSWYPLPSLPDPFRKNFRILAPFPTKIPSLLDKFSPDIVHLENPQLHFYYSVYYWCKIHKKPLITSAFGQKNSFINKSLFSLSDLVFDPAGKNSYADTLTGLLHS
jgi:hypothetical protein